MFKNIPTISSVAARKAREKLGLNQSIFWKSLGVTQSGGSRYETNRGIPAPVNRLLVLKTSPGECAMRSGSRTWLAML